jgi:flavin reductase (DIM6/NTAB) family NADH-FMN oxidoreductase RutF
MENNEVMVDFDPAEHAPGNIYKLMIGAIVPRPIAWVSTIDKNGVRNLAPFSFFTGVCANPPVVCFCPVNRGQPTPGMPLRKDTLRNIHETGEFVVNIVPERLAAQMNISSAEVPADVDEFALTGLTAIPGVVVKAPRVAESPVHMECKLLQVLTINSEPLGGNLVLGQVLRFHVRQDLMSNYRIDPEKLDAIGRMAGATYSRTRDRFELERPK